MPYTKWPEVSTGWHCRTQGFPALFTSRGPAAIFSHSSDGIPPQCLDTQVEKAPSCCRVSMDDQEWILMQSSWSYVTELQCSAAIRTRHWSHVQESPVVMIIARTLSSYGEATLHWDKGTSCESTTWWTHATYDGEVSSLSQCLLYVWCGVIRREMSVILIWYGCGTIPELVPGPTRHSTAPGSQGDARMRMYRAVFNSLAPGNWASQYVALIWNGGFFKHTVWWLILSWAFPVELPGDYAPRPYR